MVRGMWFDLFDVPLWPRRSVGLDGMLVGLGWDVDMHIYVDDGSIELVMFGILLVVVCGEGCLWGYLGGGWDILLYSFLVIVVGFFVADAAHV